MATDKKHAMWMENKEGERGLYHADDVEAALLNGYTKLEGERANGEPWNPEPEEGEVYQLDAAAEAAKATKEAQAKKDEKKAKAAEEQRKLNEKAAKDADQQPDMKVQVVHPKK